MAIQSGKLVTWQNRFTGKLSVYLYTGISGLTRDDLSRKGAKAQRRKALPHYKGFLCAFAPLRENILLGTLKRGPANALQVSAIRV